MTVKWKVVRMMPRKVPGFCDKIVVASKFFIGSLDFLETTLFLAINKPAYSDRSSESDASMVPTKPFV